MNSLPKKYIQFLLRIFFQHKYCCLAILIVNAILGIIIPTLWLVASIFISKVYTTSANIALLTDGIQTVGALSLVAMLLHGGSGILTVYLVPKISRICRKTSLSQTFVNNYLFFKKNSSSRILQTTSHLSSESTKLFCNLFFLITTVFILISTAAILISVGVFFLYSFLFWCLVILTACYFFSKISVNMNCNVVTIVDKFIKAAKEVIENYIDVRLANKLASEDALLRSRSLEVLSIEEKMQLFSAYARFSLSLSTMVVLAAFASYSVSILSSPNIDSVHNQEKSVALHAPDIQDEQGPQALSFSNALDTLDAPKTAQELAKDQGEDTGNVLNIRNEVPDPAADDAQLLNRKEYTYERYIPFIMILSVYMYYLTSKLLTVFTDIIRQLYLIKRHIKFLTRYGMETNDTGKKTLKITDGKIEFKKVTLNYHENENRFKDKTLTIEPGQRIALTGLSGSGKTSFAYTILRLIKVSSGKIFIDGQDINQVSLKSLNNTISFLQPKPLLFKRTVKENIAYGCDNQDDASIIEAATKACCHDFIMHLEKGYDTVIEEVMGTLTPGRKYRILIARAILKNAPIVFIDEPNFDLDALSAKQIKVALNYLFAGKTVIIIAHRLETLKKADRILVFENGTIVEDGTHKELLRYNEVYASLWHMRDCGYLPATFDR